MSKIKIFGRKKWKLNILGQNIRNTYIRVSELSTIRIKSDKINKIGDKTNTVNNKYMKFAQLYGIKEIKTKICENNFLIMSIISYLILIY